MMAATSVAPRARASHGSRQPGGVAGRVGVQHQRGMTDRGEASGIGAFAHGRWTAEARADHHGAVHYRTIGWQHEMAVALHDPCSRPLLRTRPWDGSGVAGREGASIRWN